MLFVNTQSTYVWMCVCIYIHTRVYTYVCICPQSSYVCVCIYVHTYIHVCMYMCMYMSPKLPRKHTRGSVLGTPTLIYCIPKHSYIHTYILHIHITHVRHKQAHSYYICQIQISGNKTLQLIIHICMGTYTHVYYILLTALWVIWVPYIHVWAYIYILLTALWVIPVPGTSPQAA